MSAVTSPNLEEAFGSPEAVVTDSCEPLDVGAGNRT